MKPTIYHTGCFLHEPQIVDTGKYCPICRSDIGSEFVVPIQRKPDINLLKCHYCHGLYASKMPKQETLEQYYRSYYSKQKAKVTFCSEKKFATHLLKYIKPVERDRIRVLDFGGGEGDLGRALAENLSSIHNINHLELDIVDYHATLNDKKDNLTIRSFRNLEAIQGDYDIVLASAILEHIPDMYTAIVTLFSRVRPNGFFYARTPYISPFMKLSGKVSMTYPAHVHDLGDGFWNRAIQTYKIDAHCISSKPSIVETSFNQNIIRPLLAYLFKFPAYIESFVFRNKKDMLWPFSGGWEMFLQLKSKYIILGDTQPFKRNSR